MPTYAQETKWGEDNPIENVPVLSEEEKDTIKQRMAVLDKLLAEQKKAKYKIEVLFGRERNLRGLSPGMVSVWESGAKMHGGGDTKMYFCPGKSLKRSDCTAFIPDVSNGYGFLCCPGCNQVWSGDDVFGEVFHKRSMRDWAEILLQLFVRLEHNADLYAKYPKEKVDIRVVSEAERVKQHMGEKLEVARKRVTFIYPLQNIIKDTSNGADLLNRIYAFLTA